MSSDETLIDWLRNIQLWVLNELKDFTRIHLAKGETKTVSFLITADKLQYSGPDMKRIVEPGEFEVMVGKSSVDFLSDKFEIIE